MSITQPKAIPAATIPRPAPAGNLFGHRHRRPGSKVTKRSGVSLTVAGTTTLDRKLEIGGLNQEVMYVAKLARSD